LLEPIRIITPAEAEEYYYAKMDNTKWHLNKNSLVSGKPGAVQSDR
jgi:hypothetical protein